MNQWSAYLVASVMSEQAGRPDVVLDVPPDLLEKQRMPVLRRYLSETQAQDVEDRVMTCLAMGSSLLVKRVALKFIRPSELSTTHLTTSAARVDFAQNRPIVSVQYRPRLGKSGRSGRPDRTSAKGQLIGAIAMTVARLDMAWSMAPEQFEQDAFLAIERRLEGVLGTVASLFNINASHYRASATPIADYCRNQGPALLAAHYRREISDLNRLYAAEVGRRGLEWAMGDEWRMLQGLVHLSSALETQRTGETSRTDSLSRFARRNGTTIEKLEGTPPRMHKSVRDNLVLESWRNIVNPSLLLKASMRFGLEAVEIFPSRQYLLPLLRAAAAAGQLALRKQTVTIDTLLLAGGITALFENAPVRDRLDDDLERMSSYVRTVFLSGLDGRAPFANASNVLHPSPGEPALFEPRPGGGNINIS
ncbi:hypothetical protein [Devosia elaeis]|uniref:Uncharacterized protein n=1 Tax=Devosia elaeis TaxID=1770058 RepID=A0A178HYZ1_9HYPH|nr:hypothetical protein [Devosia elaeis]OAM77887.1 hypothetical protein A3840_07945 [Devosia elaeis]